MNKEKTTNTYVTIIAIIIIIVLGYIVFHKNKKPVPVPVSTPVIMQQQTAPVVQSEIYTNNQYGFNVSLPTTWKGYTVISQSWTGTMINNPKAPSLKGPELLIRNPQWTAATPRQDIPIMIFTTAQWDLVNQNKLSLGAAPIGPTELGHNANYIFALPARYNFAYLPGYQEVQQIIDSKSFKAI